MPLVLAMLSLNRIYTYSVKDDFSTLRKLSTCEDVTIYFICCSSVVCNCHNSNTSPLSDLSIFRLYVDSPLLKKVEISSFLLLSHIYALIF